jgi:hypothetical protein
MRILLARQSEYLTHRSKARIANIAWRSICIQASAVDVMGAIILSVVSAAHNRKWHGGQAARLLCEHTHR